MMHEGWGYWLSTYGVWAVLLGTFLEGESILVAGAIAARHGYMSIGSVLFAALVGSFTGDQLWFLLGRVYGRKFLLNRPKWKGRVAQVHRLLGRYHTAFILGFRFLYGLRSAAPFVLGTSSVPAKRFVPLNFFGALLWSLTVGGLGYAIGQMSFSSLIVGDGDWPLWLYGVVGVLVIAVGILVWRRVQSNGTPSVPSAEGAEVPEGPEADDVANVGGDASHKTEHR